MAATEQQLANRKRLIDALRAEMPKGFQWDFEKFCERDECGTVGCAVGLAHIMGLIEAVSVRRCAEAVGLDYAEAKEIFQPNDERDDDTGEYLVDGYDVLWSEVTPQMVADMLESA